MAWRGHAVYEHNGTLSTAGISQLIFFTGSTSPAPESLSAVNSCSGRAAGTQRHSDATVERAVVRTGAYTAVVLSGQKDRYCTKCGSADNSDGMQRHVRAWGDALPAEIPGSWREHGRLHG